MLKLELQLNDGNIIVPVQDAIPESIANWGASSEEFASGQGIDAISYIIANPNIESTTTLASVILSIYPALHVPSIFFRSKISSVRVSLFP
mmetsp:Transcript_8209/g.11643  ORF Transcript_8209/g.11643 Transcript_8209/m.11643 type:complete len:91 (-) Transcript_8209:46-318(-)